MKPLNETVEIENVFNVMRRIAPDLEIPEMHNVHIFSDRKELLGLGSSFYGIGINANALYDGMQNLAYVVIHELVHFNGILGHGADFCSNFKFLHELYLKEVEENAI